MKRGLSLFVPALVFVALGCGGETDLPLAQRPVRVVTTTGMITDLATNIGGERVRVTGLMGAGVDPHLYKASEGDVLRLASADVIFYNGLHLEGRMTKVFERMQRRARTAAVSDGIPPDRLLDWEEGEGSHDPHVWFDVGLWMKAAETVRDTLADVDPEHADVYRNNATRYLDQLAKLDHYVRRRAAEVPESQRVLVTAHDAFHYFGRAYAFEVRGLQGVSTAAEAGVGGVQSLADLIADRRIAAIFVESSVPARNIEAVQEAVRSRGFRVRIGGELFSDAMGDPGTPQGTYDGMVRHNIDTIVNALLGREE
jgi:manganese/zinc/iron transport system substrate-binding protein